MEAARQEGMKSPLVKLPVSRHGCWPKEAPLVLLRILHRALIILCDSRAMVLHFVSICDGNGSWPMTSSLDCGTSALAPTRLGCISSETQVRPMCLRHAGGLQRGHLGSGGHHHYEEPGAPHSVPGVQGPPPPTAQVGRGLRPLSRLIRPLLHGAPEFPDLLRSRVTLMGLTLMFWSDSMASFLLFLSPCMSIASPTSTASCIPGACLQKFRVPSKDIKFYEKVWSR